MADTAALLLAAEQIGAAARGLELTVAYTKDRVQFGRPIGSFQALKHRMADLYVKVQTARAVVYDASRTLPASAALARVAATEALPAVVGEAVQMHGGIAITWEHDIQLYSSAPMAARNCSDRRESTCGGSKPRCSNVAAVSTPDLSVALRAGIPPFYVMDGGWPPPNGSARHGDLVNLSAGQPASTRPDRSGRPLRLRWPTTSWGTPSHSASRNCGAIAASYLDRHGLTVSPNNVVVTTGSTGGFLLAFLACFDVGDRVAVPAPDTVYQNILSALGCEVVEVPCGPESGSSRPRDARRDRARRSRASCREPRQPHGHGDAAGRTRGDRDMVRRMGVRLISDEIYRGLGIRRARTPVARGRPRGRDGRQQLSKYVAMTGWRLGWLLVPRPLLRAVDCLTGNFSICPPTLSQQAAVAAFTPESVRKPTARRAVRRIVSCCSTGCRSSASPAGSRRRRVLRLRRISDARRTHSHSAQSCWPNRRRVRPGIDFDTVHGGSFVRLSFPGPTAESGGGGPDGRVAVLIFLAPGGGGQATSPPHSSPSHSLFICTAGSRSHKARP